MNKDGEIKEWMKEKKKVEKEGKKEEKGREGWTEKNRKAKLNRSM